MDGRTDRGKTVYLSSGGVGGIIRGTNDKLFNIYVSNAVCHCLFSLTVSVYFLFKIFIEN
jgi:hypothetical protein